LESVTRGRLTNEGDDSGRGESPGEADDALAQRAQSGDRDSLSTLYRRYVAEIYRYAYRQVGNQADAEDLTSQIFLQVVRSIEGYKPQGYFRAWVYGIAKKVIVDWWRKYYKTPTIPLEDFLELETVTSADRPALNPDAEPAVERLMAQLPERYREVLTLRFLRGYSLEETAEAMGISLANAKVIQHRAVKRAAEIGLD